MREFNRVSEIAKICTQLNTLKKNIQFEKVCKLIKVYVQLNERDQQNKTVHSPELQHTFKF